MSNLNKSIHALQEKLEKEKSDNVYLNNHIRGTKVLYGDLILLRHLESDMYLSLNQNEAAEENGCVACKLMPLNEHSLISIVPQDVLRQPGQIILYQDNFFIQSYIKPTANKQAKYLHTSLYKLEKDDDPEKVLNAVLEVNGSSDTSSYKARLFQPYDFFSHIDESLDENIFSGDVVKLYHKQSNGYLTVKMPINSLEQQYNPRIIREKEEFKEAEQKLAAIMKKLSGQQNKQKQDQKNQAYKQVKKIQQEKYEEKEPQIIIEIDPIENNKAKYMWEIQKLNPFVIKQLNSQDIYRIKHVQTGLYLCVKKSIQEGPKDVLNSQQWLNNSSFLEQEKKDKIAHNTSGNNIGKNQDFMQLDLSLRELDDEYDFLFRIQKETIAQSIRQDNLQMEESEARNFEPIKNLTMIFMSTFEEKLKIQAVSRSADQINPEKEIKSSIFKNSDQIKNMDPLDVRCMEDSKESQSQMLFTVQKAKKSQAKLVRASSEIFGNALFFFKKLNAFAEVDELENNELNNNNKDPDLIIQSQQQDVKEGEIKYFVYKKAKAKEGRLQRRAKHFVNNLINLKQTLRYLQNKNPEEYRLYQNYLDESGVIDILIKLLDLVNIKTTPQDKRYIFSKQKRNFEFYRSNKLKLEKDEEYKDSLADLVPYKKYLESETDIKLSEHSGQSIFDQNIKRQQAQNWAKNKNSNDTPYYITNQIVKHIPAEVLQIILLMITGNEKVDKKLDLYPTILFRELLGENVRKAKKIFKVSYGLSRLTKARGDFQSCQEANDKQVSNQLNLKRWIDLIFDPLYIDEKTQNLKQQVIFFKVISLICQDQKGDGIFENQQLVFRKLLQKDNRTRQIFFGMQEFQGSFQPYIQFSLRSRKSNAVNPNIEETHKDIEADLDLFYKQNPLLKFLIEKKDQKSNDYKKSSRTPPIKLLRIFDNDSQSNQDYWSYAQYLCAYLDFLITCIRNGQKHAKQYASMIGLDALFIFNLIDQTKSFKLKVILIKLLTFLYINNDIIYGEYAISNRCYFWSKVQPDQIYHKKMQFSNEVDEEIQKADLEIEADPFQKVSKQEIEEINKKKKDWDKQKKKVYRILPKMIEKILMVDARWEDEEYQLLLPEQEKEQKEIEAKPKQRLSLIIAALESSLQLIWCEKSSPILIFKIIYASAIVFSWFKFRKNKDKARKKGEQYQEDDQKDNRFKNFRLFRLLQKSRQDQTCKELIDEVFDLLLKNLVYICSQRTDQQIMIALKSFKSQIDENLLTFLLAQNFKKKILKSTEEKFKKEEIKLDSFTTTLLSLYSLEAKGFPVLSDNFIQSLKNEKIKKECSQLNQFYTQQGDTYLKYNLNEFLLFLIFDKKLNTKIKSMAFEVLMQNFEANNYFKKEISKIFLLVDDMEKQYRKLQKMRYSILLNAQDVIWESFRIHHFSQEQKKSYKYYLTFKNVKNNLTKFENQIEDLMSSLNFSDPYFSQKQQMLKFLEIPKLFIDYIMKNINYKRRLHLELFKLIMDFLYVYSHQNPENSESLISQLDFLSSLQQIDLQNEKLITQIVKQLKNQEKESQLIDHIIKQINRLSKVDMIQSVKKAQDKKLPQYYKEFPLYDNETQLLKSSRQICQLLKSLNLLAQNSIFNKGNIFNKILQLEKFYDFLFFSSSKVRMKGDQRIRRSNEEKKDIDLITQCVGQYKAFIVESHQLKVNYLKINFNSNRERQKNINQKKIKEIKSKSLPRFTYILHRRILSLLIQCSLDQQNAIPQIAKIVPLDSLLRVLKSIETPYKLKKKYLRILLQIHMSQFDDQTNQTYFKEDSKLRKIFSQIVYEDLLDFPFALAFSLEKAQQKLLKETELKDALMKIAKYLIENQNQIIENDDAYKALIEDENVKTYINDYKDIQLIPQEIIEKALEEKLAIYNDKTLTASLSLQQVQMIQQLRQYYNDLSKSDDPQNEKSLENQYDYPQSTPQQNQIQSQKMTQKPDSLVSIIAPSKTKVDNQDNKTIQSLINDLPDIININRLKIQNLRNSQDAKSNVVINNYEPRDVKYIDKEDSEEYWQYLSSVSTSMEMKDGLIHFIKDFFQNIKWDISTEDIDKFRDFVLSPLNEMRKRLEEVNAKNLNIVPNGDELAIRVEEAIDAINDAFQRSEDKFRVVTDNNEQENSQLQGVQNDYLKQVVFYKPDTPLPRPPQQVIQPQSRVEHEKHINKTEGFPQSAGRISEDKAVRFAINKPIEDQENLLNFTLGEIQTSPFGRVTPYAIQNQSQMSLVPSNENQKLKKLYTQKVNETKMKRFFQYQKEDNDDICKLYFQKFSQIIIERNIGLGELFGITKSYDSTLTIKKIDFLKKVKEAVQFETTDNSFKFYSQIIAYQSKKQKEESQKYKEISQQSQNTEDVSLGHFGELLILNYEEELFQKSKKIFKRLVNKNYQSESSQHQILKRSLKEFSQSIKTDSSMKSQNDMKKIIDIIIETFEEQQKKADMANFFDNMIAGLRVQDQRYYILQLLKGILDHYLHQSKDVQNKSMEAVKEDVQRFQIVMQIMKECKLSEHLIMFLNQTESEEVSLLSIKILNLLLEGNNKKMQEQLFEFIKIKQDDLDMAEYLKHQIELLTPIVIHQKFIQIREYNNAHLSLIEQSQNKVKNVRNQEKFNENSQNFFLSEYDIGQDEEKAKALIKLQEQRSQTIKKLCSILRFIQLLCDNCHLGFQNYFRDQLTIQQSRTSSSLYQTQIISEQIENTSSFNIIVIVITNFMMITDSLKDLIFFDRANESNQQVEENLIGIGTLVQQFFDVTIDFLYGPCEENQILLSGWQKFLTTVDFYFNSQDIFFFAQNQSQEQRFNLMFKASLLLLGIIENPNPVRSKQILHSLYQGISFANLQKIMISIHRQKILAIPESEEIFKTRRRFIEEDLNFIKENKIYPKNSLRPSDEVIFEISFNIFKFLYISKRLNPLIPQLQSQKISSSTLEVVKKLHSDLMVQEKHTFIQRLYREKVIESDLTLEFFKSQIIELHDLNDEQLRNDPAKLIKVFKFLLFKNQKIRQMENDTSKFKFQNSINQIVVKGNISRKSIENYKSHYLSKLQASTHDEALLNQNSIDINTLMLDKNEESSHHIIKRLIHSFEQQEEENLKKISNKAGHEFDDTQDDLSAQDENTIQTLKALEHFQLEKALQFYTEYTAEVEVDYQGTLVRSIFKIPSKCAFLSSKSRENILYGQQNNSLYDKLEGLFSQMNVLIAEMKSNQRLSRKSKIRYWISTSNPAFQTLATVLIVLINIVYLIFYAYDDASGSRVFTSKNVDILVLVLAIAQAIVAFFIHLGYIDKYHGAYYQKYIESQKESLSEKFTNFKGSLGYAEGTKIRYEQRDIVENEIQNLREQYNRQKRLRKKSETLLQDILYGVKIYFIGLNQDPIHAFNLLFFACSIGAISYPFLFSLLLLENILQIPLLFNVIKAIVNNRKQILLTLLLLLVIVYVYSFVAFITFRDTYVSLDTGYEPPYNSYCERLGYCFTSTLNNGVRSGGGIGDTLEQLSIDDEMYWGRYVFDLTFYIMIIVLLLNLIFGIIIDAFAAMRDQRNEVEIEVKEKCYICGKASSVFESKKKSFEDHIQREHNVYAYIYYIFYLSRKPMTECTGVERYVQNMIIKEDPNFFPIDRSLALEEQLVEEKPHLTQ